MSDRVREVVDLVRERLVFLREIGAREVTRVAAPARRASAPIQARGSQAERPSRGAPATAGKGVAPAAAGAGARAAAQVEVLETAAPSLLDADRYVLPPGASPAEGLEALRVEEIGDCKRCKLWRGRTRIVFGSGNPKARLMFVGEGPGADEDDQGLPFVGRAGQKLTEIIEKGMGIPRSEVYIANIIKCRPPENRDPEAEEIAACEGFLLKQIDIIRPKVVVALGKFAAQTLLRSKMPISSLRGRFWRYRDCLLMPTFHPAFLLRQYTPENRRIVWEDLKKVKQALDAPDGSVR